MITGSNPWDQLPTETDREYEEFTTWLTNATYKNGHHKRDLSAGPSLISYDQRRILASRNHWNQRATSYDAHHRDLRQQAQLEHHKDIYEQHIAVTQQLAQLALNTIDTINPNDLDDKSKIGILKTLNEYVSTITNYTPTTTTTTTTTATLTDTNTTNPNPTRTLEHIITELQQRKTT